MKLHELFTDDRAVSPVVGVALLIAITVILAAVIGGVVLGLGTGGVDTPQAQMQLTENADGNYELVHNGGEPLPADHVTIKDQDDNEHDMADDLTAGNSEELTELTLAEGDEVIVLWDDPNSDSTTVLEKFEL